MIVMRTFAYRPCVGTPFATPGLNIKSKGELALWSIPPLLQPPTDYRMVANDAVSAEDVIVRTQGD